MDIEEKIPIEESIHPASVGDQPTKDDILGFKPYVKAIADFLINKSTKPPLTLSIEGQWGTGKSSFMLQLEENLRSRGQLTVNFNAWRHDKEEALWAAFALDFIHKVSHQRPMLRRYCGHLYLFIRRLPWKNRWLDGLRVVAILSFIIYAAIKVLPLQEIVTLGGYTFAIVVILSFIKKFKESVGNPIDIDFKKYFQLLDYENRLAFVENFHTDFKKIVEAYAGKNKVYVFIDDLDRCEVPKAADLMQALNLMITDDSGLIFIIGMDREKIAASFAVKHEKLLPYLCSTKSPSEASSIPVDRFKAIEYGYTFIEKFIQLPFLVPEPAKPDLKRLLDEISNDKGLSDKNEGRFSQVKNFFRYKILKAIKPVSIEANSEHIPPELTEEQKLRYQTIILAVTGGDSPTIRDIALMVAPALDNNPRRLKQFINLFRLKTFIAYETGLFAILGESNEDVLALEQLGKFVAISLKWPLLIMDLDANRNLLSELQEMALNQHQMGKKSDITGYKQNDPIVHWSEDQKLMDLLLAGCTDHKTQQKCNLSKLNINKLLKVSPRLVRPSPMLKPESHTIQHTTDSILVRPSPMLKPEETHVIQKDLAYAIRPSPMLKPEGDLDKELEYYEKALKLDEELENKKGMAISYTNVGNVYRTKGDLDKALESFEKALKLDEELGSKQGMAISYTNVGYVYRTRGDLDKAMESFEKALKLDEELERKKGMAISYGNMGDVYRIRGDLDKALEYYERELKLDEELGSKKGMAISYGQIGDVYRTRGDFDKALEYYEKELKISKVIGSRIDEAQSLMNIGDILVSNDEKKRAIDYYLQAQELATENPPLLKL